MMTEISRLLNSLESLWLEDQQFKLVLLLMTIGAVWWISPQIVGPLEKLSDLEVQAFAGIVHCIVFAAVYGREPMSHFNASHIERNAVYYVIGIEIASIIMNLTTLYAINLEIGVILHSNYVIINTILFLLQLIVVGTALYVDKNTKLRRDRRTRDRDIGSGHYRIQSLGEV